LRLAVVDLVREPRYRGAANVYELGFYGVGLHDLLCSCSIRKELAAAGAVIVLATACGRERCCLGGNLGSKSDCNCKC
jgi:hypothetical protein